MDGDYDYIIIGSGSAGSALAYRLGEDGTKRILVLEYGGSDAGPLIQMPAALSYPMNMKRYDWGYLAEPEPALGGRSLVCPGGMPMCCPIFGGWNIRMAVKSRGAAGPARSMSRVDRATIRFTMPLSDLPRLPAMRRPPIITATGRRGLARLI